MYRIFISTVAALAAGLLLHSNASAEEKPRFKAGAAVADISPDVFPFQLRSGPSEFVHDPISVRALALENGADHRALIAIIDAIGIGREMADEAKRKVAEKTGWDPESIMIAATHAHTTPKRLLKNPGMENCETFCLLARRDEGAGFPPRLRSNEARKQKGRSPAGRSKFPIGKAANSQPENTSDFPLWGFSTVS